MGKYMSKSKTIRELAIMEASLGVRTRARTLALQRLQKSAAVAGSAGGSYLQLRSRRLEKPPILVTPSDSKRQKHPHKQSNLPNLNAGQNLSSRASSRLKMGSVNSGSVGAISIACLNKEAGGFETEKKGASEKVKVEGNSNDSNNLDVAVEASSGENVLEFEGRERSTRETTPSSLIRDPDAIRTPGSTTRTTSWTEENRRVQNSARRHIPTAHEMDEFFVGAEKQKQKQFVEKYNFDPVNDVPLPGRYEWKKVDP